MFPKQIYVCMCSALIPCLQSADMMLLSCNTSKFIGINEFSVKNILAPLLNPLDNAIISK